VKQLAKRVLPKSVLRQIRLFKQQRTLSHFKSWIVHHEYCGFPLDVEIADPTGASWYDCDWELLPEIDLLRKSRLKPGSVVFDLGAHQAVVALMLSKIVAGDGKVIAVEANQHNFRVAQRNKELNDAHNLHLVHAAASNERGTLVFNELLNGAVDDGSGQWGKVEIEAVTVDDLAAEFDTPQVLFIDVEGFECQVLDGASSTLESGPDCFVEVHMGEKIDTYGGSLDRLLEHFPGHRYDLFMKSEDMGAFIPFDAAAEVTRERFFLIALNKYGESGIRT
jgi:FkbM family methyltransferase